MNKVSDQIIRTENLTKIFDGTKAVDSIDLEVKRGEIFGLLGPNGAGKTTTVKMLITLIKPSKGSARVTGYDVSTQQNEIRRKIGYVSQELTADINLTARENLVLHGNIYHLSSGALKKRMSEVVDLVELSSDDLRKLVKVFSGGMKKKLDIACGLIHKPDVLFLDEPSLGLDVSTRRKVWDHIRKLKQEGITILLCTNYMDEADQLCDRIAIIDTGKVKALDSPNELKKQVGGDMVTVMFTDTKAARSKEMNARLGSLSFVREIIPDGHFLNITIDYDESAVPQIIQAASELNQEVQSVTYSRPTLDDVFLKFAGHRMGNVN